MSCPNELNKAVCGSGDFFAEPAPDTTVVAIGAAGTWAELGSSTAAEILAAAYRNAGGQ